MRNLTLPWCVAQSVAAEAQRRANSDFSVFLLNDFPDRGSSYELCYNHPVPDPEIPLLRHPLTEPSAFTAEGLISAVRNERGAASATVPRVCLLEFDGDLTDWLVENGHTKIYKDWACFHTLMHSIDVDGTSCGIIARTIGGPYAVLIAEQLKVSGAEVVLGLTSAGRVAPALPLPNLTIVREAVRDEGTSYHYLSPNATVQANAALARYLEEGLGAVGLPTFAGRVWTTDAPYRETKGQLDDHAANGVLAVEMQAASLLAFSQARDIPVGVVALVSNAVDQAEENFNKGTHLFGKRIVEAMCRSAIAYLNEVQHDARISAQHSG